MLTNRTFSQKAYDKTAPVLTSRYGNRVTPVIAFYDDESGCYVGADCKREHDQQIRFYRVDQLRACGGAEEIQILLDEAPIKETTDSPRYNAPDA
jgi:hypothetical protein